MLELIFGVMREYPKVRLVLLGARHEQLKTLANDRKRGTATLMAMFSALVDQKDWWHLTSSMNLAF